MTEVLTPLTDCATTIEQQLAELRGKVRKWATVTEKVSVCEWLDGTAQELRLQELTDEMRQAVNEPEGGGGEA